jgi:hypothetical protein
MVAELTGSYAADPAYAAKIKRYLDELESDRSRTVSLNYPSRSKTTEAGWATCRSSGSRRNQTNCWREEYRVQ